MTTREEFEAAMQKLGASIERSKLADEAVGIDYQWDDTEFMWQGFKLGRAAALEEAAKECDLMAKSYDASFELERADAAEQCALGIRALK